MLIGMAKRRITLHLLPLFSPRRRTVDCCLSQVDDVLDTRSARGSRARAGQAEVIGSRCHAPIRPVVSDVVPGVPSVLTGVNPLIGIREKVDVVRENGRARHQGSLLRHRIERRGELGPMDAAIVGSPQVRAYPLAECVIPVGRARLGNGPLDAQPLYGGKRGDWCPGCAGVGGAPDLPAEYGCPNDTG